MVCKASLKKINDIIQWIVAIVMIGICIYYFFISKNMFKEMQWLIIWSGIGIMSAGRLIDAKYFEDKFSWKNNWSDIITVFLSVVIVIMAIKELWL
ncbi:hypothetical protein [Clostridium tagluense]|uniref:hypothetical protein n=1 Tax=Clostridium tagluense TaxID=360422 RepID=UPI001C0E61F0|nr:hypothetical protein [Clostridium tagluense]MBU3129464.1 hypothetical protein [Clostridium tagluense]